MCAYILENVIICLWQSSWENQCSAWNWRPLGLFFRNFITCSAGRQADKTIWNQFSSRWTSVDKFGRKAIKFATLVFFQIYVLLYCFEFFIRIERLTINVGNYSGPRKKAIYMWTRAVFGCYTWDQKWPIRRPPRKINCQAIRINIDKKDEFKNKMRIFPHLLKCRKTTKFLVWWNSLNKQKWNITTTKLLCLIYSSFYLYLSSCQIHHNLAIQHTHIHIRTYTYTHIYIIWTESNLLAVIIWPICI